MIDMIDLQNWKDKKILLVYHMEDNDGTFSAAIIFKWMTEYLNVTKENVILCPCTYVSLDYHNDLLDGDIVNVWKSKYDMVVMTDISFNDSSIMKNLYKIFENNFLWIDHHAPIIKESIKSGFDNIKGLRDTHHSALYLAYKYLYDPIGERLINNEMPELLKILSAWDSWSYEREGYSLYYVMEINKAISLMTNIDFYGALTIINQIMDKDGIKTSEDLKKITWANITGAVICEYDKFVWENLMKHNVEEEWTVCGRKAAALFTQGPTTSQMFDYIKDKVQVGIVFKKVKYQDKWAISLYNTKNEYDDEFDCGAYLKENYHGGGHKGAAGATITQSQFNKLMKTKNL